MTRPQCQRCRELMDDWLNSELSVETTQEILRHVERCEDCRVELERRQTVRRLLQRRLDPSLPPTLRSQVMQALVSAPPRVVDVATAGETTSSRILNALRRKRRTWSRAAHVSVAALAWPWRPSTIGLALGAALAAFVWWAGKGQPISAAELLTKSSHAERALAAQPTISVHRTFNFEERVLPSGTVVTRRRIEVWRNGRTGVTARRAFDDRNRLVAAEWMRHDGSSTIYRPGTTPAEHSATIGNTVGDRVRGLLESRELWRMDVSPLQFVALAPVGHTTQVRQTADEYEISYTGQASGSGGLSTVTLTLRRDDLHPVRERLVVTKGDDLREYRLTERAFEPVPTDRVTPTVFEPDTELVTLQASALLSPSMYLRLPAAPTRRLLPLPMTEVDPALEVEALYALHQVGADLRERPYVTKAAGVLEVRASVATEQRKAELLAALAPIAGDSSVHVDILVDPTATPPAPPQPAIGSIPTANVLRRYFSNYLARRLPADQPLARDEIAGTIDDAVERMTARVCDRASNARQHAVALNELVERFGTLTLVGLSTNANATWQTMIRDHARAVRHETEALRLELQPVFFATAIVDDDARQASDLANPAELVTTVKRLATLTDAHNRAVKNAFTTGGETAASLSVETEAFWRSLLEVDRITANFDRPWSLSR